MGEQNPVPGVNWLISADPPAHTGLRRLVNKAFTPRMVAALESRIEAIIGQLLDQPLPFDFNESAGFADSFSRNFRKFFIITF